MFCAGMTVGIVNLVSGMSVGILGSVATIVDAKDPSVFMKIIVLEVFASAIGLFGLISGFIQVK